MEFAILPARVDIGGEGVDKLRVNVAPESGFVEIGVVHAADDRAKTECEEFAHQLACINLPKRENPAQSHARQVFFAPAPEVLEKNVAKNHARDAARLVRKQARGHFLLVLLV